MDHFSTLNFTTVDYFTLVVLLVSALVGISRGLFKEVLALVSWFVAAWVAYHYSSYLSTEWLSTFHLDELLSLGVSFLILFVLTLIACGLLGNVIQKIILSAGLSMTDRFFGINFWFIAWRSRDCCTCLTRRINTHSSKYCMAKSDYPSSYRYGNGIDLRLVTP